MLYSGKVKLNSNGELAIHTSFGNIIEHAPSTFYSGDNFSKIPSRFVRSGKTISFELGEYNNSKTVIIDPWVQTPTLSNSNSVWECERDGAGNVYIIGGDMPMRLIKYNSTGVIQWTYNTTWDTANYWLGTFAVDLAGNSYVTSGTQSRLSKINTSGSNVWTNNSIGGQAGELWNITFNCDQTRLIIGGTQGILTVRGAIFDIDVSNGNVTTTKIAGFNKPLLLGINAPNEVRSICSAPNGNYYFLTLDSIGRIGQNFTSSTPFGFKTSSTYDLAYYNPSYRYDNAGIMATKANRYFVYTQNGSTLSKRSLGTGAVITTITIPGGVNVAGMIGNPGRVPGNSGIDIDSCGNVYVGSANSVIKYDANLVQLSSVTLPFTVFDVAISTNGDVVVAGSTTQTTGTRTGYVQSIASFAACDPMKLYCCIASIDAAGPFCPTDAASNLTAVTPGGVWSGTGITNTSTGTFDPNTAGIGTHTVYYTLACGKDSTTITVKACAALSVCKETNGDITVSGGTSPFTWQSQSTTTDCSSCPFQTCIPPICTGTTTTVWTTIGSVPTVTPPGTLPIRAIDNAGNTAIVTDPTTLPACAACAPLTASTSGIGSVNCFGQSTGSFTVSTTGGTSPYNYTLLNGSTTIATYSNVSGSQTFTALPAGTYTLNVKDNGGCPGTTTIIITEAPSIIPIASSGNTACGTSNGNVSVTASGGSGSYTYTWSNGASTQTVTGLTAGTYTVTVADANNCTKTAAASVNSSPAPVINSLNAINPLCNGNNGGSAVVTASGGSGTLTYSWSNSSFGVTGITGLSAGIYFISVTDASGCTAISSVTITEPTAITSTTFSATASCGISNGSAGVTVQGGTTSYTYTWLPAGGTGQTALNLSAGTYTVTITDANGCTATTSVAVANTGGGTANAFPLTGVTCNGGSNGSANSTMSGGAPAYTYSWSNGSTSSAISGLTAGTYVVTITDANNCKSISTVAITEPTAININVAPTAALCGTSNGSAVANASGGTGSLTYSWSTGSTSPTSSNLSAGTYSVTITDSNGCSSTKTTVVPVTGGPTADAGNSVTIISGNN
ncbi:MAG: SprB repeat-containing protein, partial [Bacteroidia bacterium]|nr:SprB repeat-containing protein [Bacteroidia bacterium]